MGTRCGVFYQRDNNSFRGTYVSYDGYLDGVGETLLKHYPTKDKIAQLIEASAHYSGIDSNVEQSLDGEAPEPHGEDFAWLTQFTLESVIDEAKTPDWEYLYVLKDGKWLYSEWQGSKNWTDFKELTQEVVENA